MEEEVWSNEENDTEWVPERELQVTIGGSSAYNSSPWCADDARSSIIEAGRI